MPARRDSRLWGRPLPPARELSAVDVLVPTAGRVAELAVTLAGLAAQDEPGFRVVISNQSPLPGAAADPAVKAMRRVLEVQGRPVELLHNHPARGMADQRQFLLDHSAAEFVLFLDDDVWLEPGQLERMVQAIRSLDCGFVGVAVQGLSYLDDRRPHEQSLFEPWSGPVLPEAVGRGTPAFERWRLHNAANLTHIAADVPLTGDDWLAYKIAWVGGCVLYRRAALVAVGGFQFGADLPENHSGEDVAAEWRVMERFGGAGILPAGAVHLEAPTTLPVRSVEAFDLLWPERTPSVEGGSRESEVA